MTGSDSVALWDGLLAPGRWVEALALVACVAVALILVRLIRGDRAETSSIWFGAHLGDGVMFPLLTLGLSFVAMHALHDLAHDTLTPIFRIAIPALISVLVVRISVRVLSATFAASPWLRSLERGIVWLAWAGWLLWITGVLPFLLEGAETIDISLGSTELTLRRLLEGSLSAALVIMVALWISAAIERHLIHGTGNDLSVRKMAANVTRALLVAAGLLLALSLVGIDLTALSVLGGALGVGLGFGLQRIAANYVGGFVMLAERAVRVGDIVKVDTFEGVVNDIRARYTVVRSMSGRESIVPNEMFISQRVENLSYTDTLVLLQTVVTVEYGSDVLALRDKLLAVVAPIPRVLADPPPGVQLSAFGPNGLELTINFWIVDPENGQGNVRSDVNFAVLALLEREGVRIAKPQLVLDRQDRVAVAAHGPPTSTRP